MAVQRRLAELVASIPESNRWKVDREIDFENTDIRGRTIPQHLGQIAAVMTNWEDAIADLLGLTAADTADIVEKYSRKPSLQRREALSIWKSRLGSAATYRALLEVFVRAGRMDCTKIIVEILKEGAEPDTTQPGATAGPPPPVSPSPGPGSGGVSTGSGTAAAATPGQSQAQTVSGNMTTSTGGVGFVPSMTPDQLAQWLLQEYGAAYKRDIDKLKDGLINGELFLELPEDTELLDDLKLTPAFKRLVKRKAKQLQESSSASASAPTAITNGSASLPPTETTAHVPLCSTADLDEADVVSGRVEPESMETDEELQGDVLKAWVPKNVLWKGRKELRVKFLSIIPQEWTYGGSGMNVGNIISWANEWYLRGGGTIPKFTRVQDVNAPSDIRVLFTNDGRRETKIGKRAQKAKHHEATMWLDLHTGGVGDDYKKHIVIHEFGHALGLGHEHQRSDFWKLIKPYVDVTKMKKDLNVTERGFKTNWDSDSQFKSGKCTAYDPESIMHYWFLKEWLKNGYHNQSKVEKDRDSGLISSEVADALLGVHLRSSVPLADKPSDMDIQLLKDLYGNTSCTILGPPSQPKMLQQTRNFNRVVSDDGGSSQGTKLILRHLSSLKTKSGGRINVIQQIAPHWQDFAMNLDFDANGTTMQTVDRKHHGDPEPCCREMMQLWLNGRGRQPATFELLVEILRECNLKVLAQQVEEAIPYN